MINDQQIESQDQKRTRNKFESEGKTAAVEEELVNSLTVHDQFKKPNATGITKFLCGKSVYSINFKETSRGRKLEPMSLRWLTPVRE